MVLAARNDAVADAIQGLLQEGPHVGFLGLRISKHAAVFVEQTRPGASATRHLSPETILHVPSSKPAADAIPTASFNPVT
uniref:Uncharacterized protein n=1 Tax=Rhizobium leguminosarum TaxID=384 RepID=A0A179BV49_RHILE|nr:hypothetical protein A4U53_39200 [Rhizobium leguminosarum]